MIHASTRSSITHVIPPHVEYPPNSMNTLMTKKDVAASAADANEEQQKNIWQLNKKKNIMS